MKKQLIKDAVGESYDIIRSKEFLNENRTSNRFFTRARKMGLVYIITFIINFLSKSLQVELDKYFEATENEGIITQQAFSKARQKIKPEAFKTLFRITMNEAIHVRRNREIKRV